MNIIQDPDKAQFGQFVIKDKLKDWPRMSDASALAFRKFVGARATPAGDLYRKGPRIFAVGDAELAMCVYNHTRQF